MDAAQLVPVIVAIVFLVLVGLAGASFGADSRDLDRRVDQR